MNRLDGIVLALVSLLGATPASALPFTIVTSANPADGWRAIAPVGNLEGQPLASVGLDWEAAHVGWNTSLGFDDSDAAGWHSPVSRTVHPATNSIWADDPLGSADTPAYFRLAFTLDADPGAAWFGTSSPPDFENVIDDDAQIYINGTLVYDDQDTEANFTPLVDVTPYLHAGANLLAIKAHDSVGVFEHISIVLQGNTIPEPATALLLGIGLCTVAFSRKPRMRLR